MSDGPGGSGRDNASAGAGASASANTNTNTNQNTSYAQATLSHLVVFRATDVKEGEEFRKVMYFFPRDAERDRRDILDTINPNFDSRPRVPVDAATATAANTAATATSAAAAAARNSNHDHQGGDEEDLSQLSGAALALRAAEEAKRVEEERVNTLQQKQQQQQQDTVLRTVSLSDQCRIIGLCEGLVNFSSLFEPGRDLETVRTKQTTSVMLKLGTSRDKSDFWAQLCVNNPRMMKPSGAGSGASSEQSTSGQQQIKQTGKDRGAPSGVNAGVADLGVPAGESEIEWKEGDVDDRCLMEVLQQLASSFRFFCGQPDEMLEHDGEAAVMNAFAAFMDEYVPSIAPSRLSLFDTLDGMHFLPVDKNVYLQLQCFVSGLENSFPFVKSCTVLYADHLLWSGLTEMDDLRVVYRYVTRFLSPWLREQAAFQAERRKRQLVAGMEISQQRKTRQSIPAPFLPRCTQAPLDARGWVVPDAAVREGPESLLPRIVLASGEHARLCIYQLQNLLCVLLLDEEENVESAAAATNVDDACDSATTGVAQPADVSDVAADLVSPSESIVAASSAATIDTKSASVSSSSLPARAQLARNERAALQQLADVVVGECAFLLPSLDEHLLAKTQQQLAAAGASPADQAALAGTGAAAGAPLPPQADFLSRDGSRFRYIYFNHMNMAVKSTILQDWQTPYKLWRANKKLVVDDPCTYKGKQYLGAPLSSGGVMLPRETVKVLHDLHADFANVGWYEQQQRRTARDAEMADRLHVEPGPGNGVSEVLVRTAGDRWICGRQSEQREFYVVFDTKSSHLIEVAEDVRRLADQYFAHIFVGV